MPKSRFSFHFSDRQFQIGHGRAPKGRGSWAFSLDQMQDLTFSPGGMTLTEARKWAVAYYTPYVPEEWVGPLYIDILP